MGLIKIVYRRFMWCRLSGLIVMMFVVIGLIVFGLLLVLGVVGVVFVIFKDDVIEVVEGVVLMNIIDECLIDCGVNFWRFDG